MNRILRAIACLLLAFVFSQFTSSTANAQTATVSGVWAPGPGNYTATNQMTWSVNYTGATSINVTGTPYINLTIGGSVVQATYSGVNPSNPASIQFTYTVQAADYSATGVVLDNTINLSGGTIQDQGGNNAATTLNNITPSNVAPTIATVNDVPPTVTTQAATNVVDVSAILNGSVTIGSSAVTVGFAYSTDPTFSTGVTQVQAGSYPTGLAGAIFAYNLTGLSPNTTYYYEAGALEQDNNQLVTGNLQSFTTGSSVGSVWAPGPGNYQTGDHMTWTVNYNVASSIAVTGTPSIDLTIGGNIVEATYSGVSPGNPASIQFTYIVQAGDFSATGVVLGSTINLNGGTIQDQNGINAGITLNNITPSNIAPNIATVNDATPVVTTLAATNVVDISATLNGSVVSGSGAIIAGFAYSTDPTLSTGVTQVSAGTIPAGTTSVPFSYNLTGLTENTTYYYQAGAEIQSTSQFFGGSVLSFTTGPSVNSVWGPAGGYYVTGQTLYWTVNYDGTIPVVVNTTGGIPYINVTIGTQTVQALYYGPKPGIPESIMFSYTIQAADFSSTGAVLGTNIFPNGGTILNQNGSGTGTLLINITPSNVPPNVALINYTPTITLTPTTLPAATVAAPYSQTITASGATSPYTYAVTSGTLPTGLTLDPNAGTLSGTPTAGGTFNFTVTATDATPAPAGPFTGAQAYTLTVNPPTITLTPSSLTATVGVAYSQAITASGGVAPYSNYIVTSGALPAGLTLGMDGTLSGTPTAGGSFNFTIGVTDASTGTGPYTESQAITMTVNAATIVLTAPPLPSATVGATYSQAISASGGTSPYTYAVTSGALPAGLTLDPNAGTLSGTPTAGGSFSFTVTATDASTGTGPYTGSQAYTLTVNAATITLTAPPLPAATVGATYSQAISASGGTSPYTYAVTSGALPAGLTLGTDGTLSGTPTAGGSFSFTVTATDASTGTGPYTGSQAYTLTVNAATIVLTAPPLPAATVGATYSQAISASGGTSPYTYAVTSGSLPAGLTLDPNAGTLSGTPTAGGSFSFTVTATDASTGTGPYTGSQAYTLTVNAAIITLTPTSLTATVGVVYNGSAISAAGGTSPYTYAVTSGTVPAGLTVNTDGTISGTPTAGGSFSFTVTATDASTGTGPFTGSQLITMTVNAATITLTAPPLPAATVGATYSQAISASGGTSPYTYAVTSGALPAGLTLGTDGTLSGTATAGGSFSFTVTATDASTGTGPYTGSQAYTLTVNAPIITLTPTTLPAATVGATYSQVISASGGTSSYTYAVTSGALPAGLTLGTDGTLSGTATAGGSFSFTVTATDASTGTGPYTGSQAYTLTVNAPIITLTPTTLPAATVGAIYSQVISASGGTSPYTYAVTSGALPAGLTLGTDGTLSGTATAGGSFSFTVTATDASTGTGPYTGSQAYTLTVNAPIITLAPTTLPAATVGATYSQAISASGGTASYTYAVTSGALPAGLTLGTDGTLSGTPTAGGSFSFTVTATDASTGTGPYTGSQAYTLTVNAAIITLAPTTLPAATVGATYSQAISAAGGTSPYTYAVTSGALPAGLTLGTDGTLSGTATAGGSFSFTVTATDASAGTGPYTGSQAYTLTVNAAIITLTPTTLPAATVGVAYSQAISASGGTSPYTYAVTSGALPAGLTLGTDGTLSGTATAGGSFSFTVTATDASAGTGPYTGSQAYTLTVNAPIITLAPTTLPAATVGAAYSQAISASGGTASYTYAVTSGALPAGLTLGTDGTLSGTATAGGSFSFTVTATDASAGTGPYTGSQAYTLTVNAPIITLAPTTLPAATVGAIYSQAISASGGTSSYTYAVTSGALPAGLTLSTSGTLSGTPTAGGSFSFTVTATDATTGAGPYTGSQAYTLTVNVPVITISPATLPNGQYGQSYPAVTFSSTGGTSPYTYAITSGTLPTGMTLSSAGVLSGTPGATGNFSFTVTATDGSGGTGPFTGSASYTLDITQAVLTITANNQTKIYGQANPTLTVSYSGFINGDNASSLTTAPTVSTTATVTSNVGGNYPITVSGAQAANYTIVYVNGTLTVTPATVTITAVDYSRYYGQPNPTLTYYFTGFVNGQDSTVLTAQPSISTTALQSSLPGQYPISLNGGTAVNYIFIYQDGVLTINPSLNNTITFGTLPTKTYGDPDFAISATATSGLPVRFVSADNSIATVTQDASGVWMVHIVAAGQVNMEAFQDGDASYGAATEVDQLLVINKANQAIEFVAPPSTTETGNAAVPLSASASSGLPVTFTVSDPSIATIVGNSVLFTGTGTVTITASQPGNEDYNAATPVSYTITVYNGGAFHSGIAVFPNPAHGTLYIHLSVDYLITKYTMFGINGQIVRGESNVTNNSNVIPIDINGVAPGYYLLRVVCIQNNQLVYPVFKVLIQ